MICLTCDKYQLSSSNWPLCSFLKMCKFFFLDFVNKDLPLGLVKDHLGSIGGVEASRIEVVLDRISQSSFRATSWSFPAMIDVWFEVTIIFLQLFVKKIMFSIIST